LTTRKPAKHENLESKGLSLEKGAQLVKLAREAITNYLENHQLIKPPSGIAEELLRKSGAFVTLNTIKPVHELRGCIGFPYPEQPLVDAVIRGAVYAATEDPRFEPLSLREFRDSVAVEVTVLTPPVTLKARDRTSLPGLIEVGRHGLIVEGKGASGLLLPQVATEWKWDASEFLMNCCLKAGLPPDSWLLDDVNVKVFEGEIFEEAEPQGEVRRKPIGEA
jgi:uncharacterized protein (TIGR00296 family)